jgi:hypothetical protein
MGHLTQDLVALGELSENPALQRVTNGLFLVLPDLERLNLRNEAIYGMQLLARPHDHAQQCALCSALHCATAYSQLPS